MYSILPASASVAAAGVTGNTVAVTAGAGCSWTATSNASFINVTGGAIDSGNGTVTYDVAANAATGQRTGTITIAGQTFTVTQSGSGPVMTLDKTSLQFGAISSGTAFTTQTTGQAVRLTQAGSGAVTWTATPSQPWITVSPTSGSGSATFTMGVVFSSSLPTSGSVSGTVTLTYSGASTPSGTVAIGLSISTGSSAVPFGLMELPTDGLTGVSGSIAVTGWALDDIEVTKVRILRDPVAGEGSLIFIGNATFVDGSRTDLPPVYPTYPRNTRGGWGYLLLTNFLPNQGNGTFVLRAYADDADGHSTFLGSKTITCDNANATRPFGAIDTPGQGATVSGSVTNFGWVLARGATRADPPGGGTVRVVIDGAFQPGSPGGWTSRSDLSALFPEAQYSGVNTALGVYGFDSTVLTNGVHTIAWVVTDNLGATDGVGSRYFTVSNGTSLVADSFSTDRSGRIVLDGSFSTDRSGRAVLEGSFAAAAVEAAPLEATGVRGRRGFDPDAPYRWYRADAAGVVTVHGEELDRFELRLNDAYAAWGFPPGAVTGALRTAEGLAPLPIGSRLDPSTGEFTWQPGVGFVGAYDFVFVRSSEGRVVARQDIRIVLHPKGSSGTGPQVVIDTPAGRAVLDGLVQPFLLAGWAVDLDAESGSGVNTLHVWAYPTDGGAPLWVGATAYGGHRPDVGAIFGDRFTPSGYGMWVWSLPPGEYDLAVFAWSTVQGQFVPAKVVRVTVR
jgi:hypothetical protein